MRKELFNKILQVVAGSATPAEIQHALDEIGVAQQRGHLSAEQAYELSFYAYSSLRESTQDDPALAKELILDGLLPLCLKEVGGRGAASLRLHQCREVLGKWVGALPGAQAENVVSAIYQRLQKHLAGRHPQMACWVISHVGFRSYSPDSRLWQLADRRGKAGNAALAALIDLGYAVLERDRCVDLLLKRVRGDLHGNAYAVQELADPRLLVALSSCARTQKVQSHTAALGSIVDLMARIADSSSENAQLCDDVVAEIVRLCTEHPKQASGRIYLGSNVLPACDSPAAVTFLLDLLRHEPAEGENPSIRAHQLLLRLSECYRPRQIHECSQSSVEEIDPVLMNLLLTMHPSTGQWSNITLENKVQALDTAFHFGIDQPLKQINEALAHASDGFSRRSLLEVYSCFRLEPLPQIAKTLVCSVIDIPKDSHGGEIMERTASLRLIRSAGTDEALSTLLQPSFTMSGIVLRDTVEALADVVLELTETPSRREEIAKRLLDVLFKSSTQTQLSAACFALRSLAWSDRLPKECNDRILSAIKIPGLDDFCRSRLISCVGKFDAQSVPEHVIQSLLQWASRDDHIGNEALHVLATLNLLHKRDDILISRLGLSRVDNKWDWQTAAPQAETASWLTTLLYKNHREEFEPAVESIIRKGKWLQCLNACVVLRRIKKDDPVGFSQRLASALVDRLKEQNTASFSELSLFQEVALLAPEKMLEVDWQEYWKNWLADARAYFADAIGNLIPMDAASSRKAQALLIQLIDDGQYFVRRCSYRSLARLDGKTLLQVSAQMARAEDYETRLRAAEAYAWVPGEMRDDSWCSLNRLLLGDIHPRVRAVAKESHKDCRQRSWAGEYLAAILDIRSGDTQEMLRVWRYGRALSQVGDDETIAKLEEHLRAKHLRSNVRHFLGRLLKLVEKTWEKTKKNWPEPFVPLSGRARTGTCILKSSDAEWSARYSIWAKAAQDISHRPAWGGWATLDHLEQMPEVVGKDATLKLEDAQEYTVFVTASSSSGTLTFSGGDKHPF